MSLAGVVDDLIALQHLAEQEEDTARRRSLDSVRKHLAERDRGAKITEAAKVLGVSAPTVRAWIAVGVLHALADSQPVRVDVASLADAKQVVDELRRHSSDRYMLADLLRILRDRASLSNEDARAGTADLNTGRVRRLDRRGLDALMPAKGPQRSTSA